MRQRGQPILSKEASARVTLVAPSPTLVGVDLLGARAKSPRRTAEGRYHVANMGDPTHGRRSLDQDSSPSGADVFRHLISREVRLLDAHVPLRHDTDLNDDIHQLRVCARRLRSELRVMKVVLTPADSEHLNQDLRLFGRQLAPLRDLQVVRDDLTRRCHVLGVHSPLLLEQISVRESALREVVTRYLQSLDARDVIRTIRQLLHDPPLRPRARHRADSLFRDSFNDEVRHFFSRLERVPEDVSLEKLHRLRVYTKRCRYNVEVGETYLPVSPRRMAKTLRQLQEVLGNLHDLSLVLDLLNHSLLDVTSAEKIRENVHVDLVSLMATWRPAAERALHEYSQFRDAE